MACLWFMRSTCLVLILFVVWDVEVVINFFNSCSTTGCTHKCTPRCKGKNYMKVVQWYIKVDGRGCWRKYLLMEINRGSHEFGRVVMVIKKSNVQNWCGNYGCSWYSAAKEFMRGSASSWTFSSSTSNVVKVLRGFGSFPFSLSTIRWFGKQWICSSQDMCFEVEYNPVSQFLTFPENNFESW